MAQPTVVILHAFGVQLGLKIWGTGLRAEGLRKRVPRENLSTFEIRVKVQGLGV